MARVIKAAQVTGVTPITMPRASLPATARVLPRSLVEAQAQAATVLADAHRAANELRLQAAAAGRAAAVAELAAQYLVLEQRQARVSDSRLQPSIELAKLLAERMIAEAIELDATLVGRLAQQSLQQLRERSALIVRAHPSDHDQIQQQIAALNLQSVSLLADPELKRGELCIDSDLGQLELRIEAGLERLIERVRALLQDDAVAR
jgi:flagellar biosynthesis/type III secretory pathway protein FliH